MTSLLCDLGGTNCRLALVSANGKELEKIDSIPNDRFASFIDLVSAYLAQWKLTSLDTMVVALAAPIEGDCIWLTNRDWKLDKTELAECFGAPHIHFINDFEALGYALRLSDRLQSSPIVVPTEQRLHSPKLVLGAGTGFNCALLTGGEEVVCCEAGHSSLVTETPLDRHLQDKFIARYGRCSTERVLSGKGMLEVYTAVCEDMGARALLLNSHDIVNVGLAGTNAAATRACEEFARILGRLTGDLSLLMLPYSGIFLTGGITRALAPILMQPKGPFLQAFKSKGRMAEHMENFPIHVLQDDHVALFGCLSFLQTSTLAVRA